MPKRSEEHTSELQSRVDISYAVFCLKKKAQSHPILLGSDSRNARCGAALVARGGCQRRRLIVALRPVRPRAASVLGVFFFNDTATTEIYTLSLHDALPISYKELNAKLKEMITAVEKRIAAQSRSEEHTSELQSRVDISYAVFCLTKDTCHSSLHSANCPRHLHATCDAHLSI